MFTVDADASNNALGSVLSQEQDGQGRVIGYYSKCFNKTEMQPQLLTSPGLGEKNQIVSELTCLPIYSKEFSLLLIPSTCNNR